MADFWPQRVFTSATSLSSQALADRSSIAKDLGHLTFATKAFIYKQQQDERLVSGGPSTIRSRRQLYKHESEGLRSVSAKSAEQIDDRVLDQQQLDQCMNDASSFKYVTLDPEVPTGVECQRGSSLEPRMKDGNVDWSVDHLFTYTWHKTQSQGACGTDRVSEGSKDDVERRCNIQAHTKAATRVGMISAHLATRLGRDLEIPREDQSISWISDECSHLRKFARQSRSTRRHLSKTDITSAPTSASIDCRRTDPVDNVSAPESNSRGVLSRQNDTHVDTTTLEFDCPFPHCQHTLNSGAYRITRWDNTSDLRTLQLSQSEGQGLMCVHDGCLDHFLESSKWQAHITTPHHENLENMYESLTERMQRVWQKRAAVR